MLISQFAHFNREIKQKMIILFDLKRDISTEVEGGVIKCDGYSERELAKISKDSIGIMLAKQFDTFEEALESLIHKLQHYEDTKGVQSIPEAPTEEPKGEGAKIKRTHKLGRPAGSKNKMPKRGRRSSYTPNAASVNPAGIAE